MPVTLHCQICGKSFEAGSRNAKYCKECGVQQKKMQDHEAYLRRRRKSRGKDIISAKDKKILRAKRILAPVHAAELGIPVSYYELWAKNYPELYDKWMNEHITEEFLFSL